MRGVLERDNFDARYSVTTVKECVEMGEPRRIVFPWTFLTAWYGIVARFDRYQIL